MPKLRGAQVQAALAGREAFGQPYKGQALADMKRKYAAMLSNYGTGFPYWERGFQYGISPEKYASIWASILKASPQKKSEMPDLDKYVYGYTDIPPSGFTPAKGFPLGAISPSSLPRRFYGVGTSTLGGAQYGATGTPAGQQWWDYGTVYQAGLPEFEAPAMEQYFKTQGGNIYQAFLAEKYKEMEEKEAKIKKKYSQSRKQALKRLMKAREAGVTPTPTRGSIRGKLRRREEQKLAELRARTPTTEEFQEYLKDYPFLEKYQRIPRAQRGEYPSRYKPPTRWLLY